MKKHRVVAFLAILGIAVSAWADDTWKTDASGNLTDGANWVSGTSPFAGNTEANNKGTLTQNSGTAKSTTGLSIRGNTNYNQTGGEFDVTGGVFIVDGGSITNTSRLTMNGGTITASSYVNIGGSSSRGEVVLENGTIASKGFFALGNDTDKSYGKFTQNNGTLDVTLTGGTAPGWLTIGHKGTGVYNLNGGTATAGRIDLATENGTLSNGSLYVNGGTMKSNGYLNIGVTGTGFVEVASSTVPTGTQLTIAGDTSVGQSSTGTGTLNLKTNGTMSTSSLYVGNNGTGTLSIADNANLTAKNRIFTSANAGASGTVTQTGGTLSTTNNGVIVGFKDASTWTMKGGTLSTQTLYVGNAGDGTFHYEGGTINLTNALYIGNSVDENFATTPVPYGTGSGTMNIQNGSALTLSTRVNVATVAGTTGTLNVNDGSLTVTGENVNVGATSGTGSGTVNLVSNTLTSNALQVNYTGNVLQSGGALETSSLTLNLGKYTMEGGTIGKTTVPYTTINGNFELRDGTAAATAFNVGNGSGVGSFTQYGGTMKTSTFFCLANSGTSTVTPIGTYHQYGGLADATGGMGWLTIGHTGIGVYNLYGGEVQAKYVDLANQNGTVSNGTVNIYGGTLTSNGSFSVGVTGTGTLNIYGGTTTVEGALDGNAATGSSVNFYANENGFGTLSAGSNTFDQFNVGFSGNGILSMKSFNQTDGYNIFTLSTGTVDTSTWKISPLFQVTSGTNTANLKFTAAALVDYVIDETGKYVFDTAVTSGWMNVTPGEYTYAMELEFDNLLNRDAFIGWINDEGTYSAQAGSTANAVEFLLFDPDSSIFAFDFSGYNNGVNPLQASSVFGRTYVPEPAAWLLLTLGMLWLGKRKGRC